jgi:general secretion pathway protein I
MKGERGFTLLEVLVATVIMALAVVGLLSSLSTSVRNASRLTDYDRVATLARRKMDELLLMPRLPRNTVLEGKWETNVPGGLESGWRARLTPFEQPPQVSPGMAVLDRLDLEVWWKSGEQTRSFRLEGYRTTILTPQDVGAP